MESDLEADDVRSLAQTVFSYLSVIITWLLVGFLFLTLIGPLFKGLVTTGRHGDFVQVVTELRDFWACKSPQGVSNKTALLYCLVALLVGFTILPAGLWFATCANRLIRAIMTKGLRQKQEPMYYQPIGLICEYAKFTDWLHAHARAKSAWEWEFFNYYLSVAIWMNVVAASFILLCTVKEVGSGWIVCVLLLVLYATIHVYRRSQVLENMFEYYKSRGDTPAHPEHGS